VGRPESVEEPRIVHADRHLVIAYKPPGIDVHGRRADDPGSLIGRVAAMLGIAPERLHPASRLDRPVSGLVPIARSKVARQSLTRQYQGRRVHRTYVALTRGVPEPSSGVWDGPIGSDPGNSRQRTIGGRDPKPAETRYTIRKLAGAGHALVELRPKTGRTHQLRVHLAAAHCPILGDRRYGGEMRLTSADGTVLSARRVMLHAERLVLSHPETGQTETYAEALPADLSKLVEALSV